MRRAGCTLLLAVALSGCGGGETRTVTVQAPGPTSTTARPGPDNTLSRADNARVARARVTLADYCALPPARRAAEQDAEAAALVVLIVIFARQPDAAFSRTDSSLALADVLKSEARRLEEEGCDRKGARMLRNAIDVGIYGDRP